MLSSKFAIMSVAFEKHIERVKTIYRNMMSLQYKYLISFSNEDQNFSV